MRLIDLSQPVFDGAPNCPAHPPVRSEVIDDHDRGAWRMELLTLASHTGSHVDSPLHKLMGGDPVDAIPLERYVGDAIIVDLRGISAGTPIGPEYLNFRLKPDQIVLIATGWGAKRAKSEEWLCQSPWLHPDGARHLVESGARGVGIDHFSIGGIQEPWNAQTHEILLGSGVWIVEDLFFPEEVFSFCQTVKFWSLPINFRGHSGAFCRPAIEISE